MKYILIFIQGAVANHYDTMPGTMFEVDRFNTLEEANAFANKYNHNDNRFIILPFYDIEK